MSYTQNNVGVSPHKRTKNSSVHMNSSQKLDNTSTTPLRPLNTLKKSHPYSDLYNQTNNQTQSSTLQITRINQSSPVLNGSMDELEFYKNECHQYEGQIAYLKKELDIQFLKNTKISQLEQKVEVVFSQNQSLQVENEKMSRMAQQYKSECNLWKTKYENYMQERDHQEMEMQQMAQQIQELVFKCEQMENYRLLSANEAESAFGSVEILRQELEVKDSEIAKLYAVVNDQSNEIGELQQRLDKLRQDNEYDSYKNSKELEHWKKQLTLMEKTKTEEMNLRLQELDLYHQQCLDTATQQHLGEVHSLNEDINNLKRLLNVKNDEIETLIQQNVKQRQQAEQEQERLEKVVDNLQNDVQEIKKENEQKTKELIQEFTQQQTHFKDQVDEQITNQQHNYENKIKDLEEKLDTKKRDIEGQQNRIQELKQWFDGEVESLRGTIENQRKEASDYQQTIVQREAALVEKQKEAEQLNQTIKEQQQKLKEQQENEEKKLQEKEDELESAFEEFTVIKSQLEEQILYLKQELDNARNRYYEQEKLKNKEIEELSIRNSQIEIQLREKVKILEVQIEFLTNELRRVKDLLEKKIQECEQHYTNKTAIERENRKIRDENEELKQKISDFEEWKARQELSSTFQMDQVRYIKSLFPRQVQSQQTEKFQKEQRELSTQLEMKSRECDELNHRLLLLEQALTDVKNKRGQGSPIKISILQSEMKVKKQIYSELGKSPMTEKENQ